jgi:hypothetical protein
MPLRMHCCIFLGRSAPWSSRAPRRQPRCRPRSNSTACRNRLRNGRCRNNTGRHSRRSSAPLSSSVDSSEPNAVWLRSANSCRATIWPVLSRRTSRVSCDLQRGFVVLVDHGQALAGETLGLAAADPFAHRRRLAEETVGFRRLVGAEQLETPSIQAMPGLASSRA